LFVFYLVLVGLGQNSKKRFWVQTQWHAGETSASPLPMSLIWGCPKHLELCVSLPQKNKNKRKKNNFMADKFYLHGEFVSE
jgi:hypothetical protein